jgi:acetyl-CoA C-acetyltransferase
VDETAQNIPVIVGVGQINDRPADEAAGLDPLGLMEAALRAADNDGGGGWLAALDWLGVVAQISFPALGDLSPPLAARLGATPRHCSQTAYPMGDSPIRLLNEAANAIAAGEIGVAAIVGGEALRTAARRAAAAAGDGAAAHNASRDLSARRAPAYRQRYGLVAPVDVYPLYENACRAAYGQSLTAGQRESAEIWARFSAVAADNAAAWIRRAVSAETIATPSPDNRPIAHPYTKLMVANSSVNQGAGFIVTSLARALAHGIAEERLIYVGRGAAAHEPADFLARDCYDRSAGMEVSLRRALSLNNLHTADLDFVELYSCFPCVPKMARRVIDWPVERDATVFGGLTFGGGPIGNYMSHAVASLVEKLRISGRHGLLFANGGFATHNHSIVLSRVPPAPGLLPQNFDFQAEADALRGPVPPLDETYAGPGRIETYTVFYDRAGAPRFGTVVACSPEGTRFLAKIPADDPAGIAFLTDGLTEPVGSPGQAVAADNGDIIWHRQTQAA